MLISPVNTEDEVTQSGATILWSQRTDADLENKVVPVHYLCCGKTHRRSIYSLNRFRRGGAVKCIECITAIKPVPDERPICPRCNLYPVARNWRGPTHQAFRNFCWSCSAPGAADPDARHLRYESWKERYGASERLHTVADADSGARQRAMEQRKREHWDDVLRVCEFDAAPVRRQAMPEQQSKE
jgi:hypothetical protein